MDSPSLAKLLDEIIDWIFGSDFKRTHPRYPTAKLQLKIVREYALKLGVDSDFSLRMNLNWRSPNAVAVWDGRLDTQNHHTVSDMVVGFFRDDLKELFKVSIMPSNSAANYTLNINERLAAVFGFLVQILHFADHFAFANSKVVIQKLRSLITILKDAPFQVTEHQQLSSLLTRFEAVANQLGDAVHYAFFSPEPEFAIVYDAVSSLVLHIDSLKPNITDFLNSHMMIPSETNYVFDSLFIVDSLLHDLDDLMNNDNDLASDVKHCIRMLCRHLRPWQSLIKDVDSPQHSENAGLKAVAIQIANAAYEAEYLIKSFLVEDVPAWYLIIRLTHLIGFIKNIDTAQQKNKDFDVGETASTSNPSQHQTGYRELETDDIMCIYENQESEILEQLLCGRAKLQSIFVAGMTGIGKSTFARKLYSHPSVNYYFDVRSWCVVSQMPQWIDILTNISSSIGNLNYGFVSVKLSKPCDEGWLAETIYKSLKGRRFFIVVDDIWSSEDREYLLRIFPDNQNGSRILFTCQNSNVAQVGSIICQLPLWSKDQCWQLLQKKVFHEEPCPPQLIEIGKEIAANCYGLPLVVVVIAGILSTMDKEESAWKNAKGSLDYYLHFDQNTSIMQMLEHSYNSLPQHLKPCFLYFGMFQEDEEILVRRLKWLWIAEGFIHEEENEGLEIIAERNLKMLINKNLVIVTQKRSDGGAKVCIVHNLLHDLCLRIADQKNFLTTIDYSIYNQNHRRMCINVYPTYQPSILAPSSLGLRSLFVSSTDIAVSLHNTKLLKVLERHTTEFGYSKLIGIESLLQLKYLVVHIPRFIERHVNLEYLIVDSKVVLTNFILRKMVKLRCIVSPSIEFDMGCEAHGTNKLECLSTVHFQKNNYKDVLMCSPNLRKLKCVIFDSLWGHEEENRCFDVRAFIQCESLSVQGFPGLAIHNLQFPSRIKKLKLLHLRLHWKKMSMIGAMPNLEILKLGRDSFVGRKWITEDGEFQKLRYLKMESLDLGEWVVDSSEHFPRIQHLILTNCWHLMGIPSEIGNSATLCAIEVQPKCLTSLLDSARYIQQEQQDMGNDGLKVMVADTRKSVQNM